MQAPAIGVPIPNTDRGFSRQYAPPQTSSVAANPLASAVGDQFVEVRHLQYAEAKETARVIGQLLGRNGQHITLAVDERTNAVLVSGQEKLVSEVIKLFDVLDRPDAKNQDFRFTAPTTALEPAAKEIKAGSVAELRQRSEALEQQSRDLAGKLKGPLSSPAEGARLNDLLRKTVHQAFAERQELQRAELAEFTKRLQGLQQSLELRQRIADKIIERRIEELLDPNLNWEVGKPETNAPAGGKETSSGSVKFPTQKWDTAGSDADNRVRAFFYTDESERAEDIQWLLTRLEKIGIESKNIGRSAKPRILDIHCPQALPIEERAHMEREINALAKEAPIRWILHFTKVKPDDALWQTKFPLEKLAVPITNWSTEQNGLRLGMRVIADDGWHVGGKARVELWVHNPSAKDVNFTFYGESTDAGVSVVAKDQDGKEHFAESGNIIIYPGLFHVTLPPGYVAKLKDLVVSFDMPNKKEQAWAAPMFRLPSGTYKLHCVWRESQRSVFGKDDWTGELTSGEQEFTLAATAQAAMREFRAGDTPLWNEFGVTLKPVTPLTAKVLDRPYNGNPVQVCGGCDRSIASGPGGYRQSIYVSDPGRFSNRQVHVH